MKTYIVSLGCPKNLTDSEAIMGQIVSSGGEITLDPKEADTIIVNTCAFLKEARDESVRVINEMAEWKNKGRCKKLYVAGCLTKGAGGWGLGTGADGVIDSIKLYNSSLPRIKATRPWTAYVKISEGCDNSCSYCLIPSIRGSLRTRSIPDILKEVKSLADRGVKEIICVAQDTTAFPHFPELLKRTAKIKGVRWIRIMYAHPEHVTESLTAVMAKEGKVLKYIDLPMQHCSDKILRSMNRRYSKNDLVSLIKKLRNKVPGICIRTTFIAGFPGETEKDFKELCDFVKEMKFDRVGVFPYSREEGTSAAKMKGQVSERVKKLRAAKLMKLQEGISKRMNKGFIGKRMEVLVEGRKGNNLIGRTYRDAPEIDGKVLIKGSGAKEGEIAIVKIERAGVHDLIGAYCPPAGRAGNTPVHGKVHDQIAEVK